MKIKSLLIICLIIVTTASVAIDKSEKAANKLLDKVRKDLISLSADFEQYEIDANAHQTEKSTGNVWLKAPSQFKWKYIKPAPQLIMANGKQVWIYDEDLEQVTIKQQNSKQNPIYVLLNKELTEKNYTVSLLKSNKDDKDGVQWIKMLPNKPSDEVKVVWLGIKDKKISALKLQNQLDNIVVFEFNNVKRNPKLAEGFFTFTIPKGIDVLRYTAEVGEF